MRTSGISQEERKFLDEIAKDNYSKYDHWYITLSHKLSFCCVCEQLVNNEPNSENIDQAIYNGLVKHGKAHFKKNKAFI